MKYTLYHIKGLKWGMTERTLKQRFSDQDYRNKGLTSNDVCEIEIYYDENTAADREKELNLKDNYPWKDSQDWRILKKMSKNSPNTKKGVKFTDAHKSKLRKSNGGDNHSQLKLSSDIVKKIRKECALGMYTSGDISRIYNITIGHASNIISNRVWKNI